MTRIKIILMATSRGRLWISLTRVIGSTLKMNVSERLIISHSSCSDFGTKNIDLDEGVYNTYIIDTDYENWALVMHCAEKKKYPRYLSALMMSRSRTLGYNVKVFLREKLPKYNIDLDFMFEVRQDVCDLLKGSMNMKDYYEQVLKNKESNEVESAENVI